MPKLNPKCSPLAWDYLLAESKSYREQCPTAECYLLNYLVHVCFAFFKRAEVEISDYNQVIPLSYFLRGSLQIF